MSMATVPISMPHMGVSVTEGTVLEWLKSEGDEVGAEEVVCLISTDKVDTDVVAPAAGVLARIVAQEGETVAVGAPLGELAVREEAAAALGASPEAVPAAAEPAPASSGAAQASPRSAPPPSQPRAPRAPAEARPQRFDPVAAAESVVPQNGRRGAPAASPVARRLAAEHGLDPASIAGSGIRGRIRKADVLAAIEAREAAPEPAAARQPAPAPQAAAPAGLLRGYDDVPHEVVEISRLRSAMAEHMIRSRQTAAHMTTEAEVDMSMVQRAREELNAPRLAAGRRKLTALSFIARATVAALREFPDLNATFDGRRLIRWKEVNLGIAVDTEEGLIVPVIRGCERLTTPAIGDGIAELASLARSRKLTLDHVRAGTFTISNPGSVGGISAMAIINQPQVGILGTPAIVRRPVVVRDEHGGESIAIRPVMMLALTFDHRVVDGAYATRCVVRIKELLETWPASAHA